MPYSCWECGSRMKMEIIVNADQVRIRVTGRRECAENWKDFAVFNFEHPEIIKEPCSFNAEVEEREVEVLVPYSEYVFYIKEETI